MRAYVALETYLRKIVASSRVFQIQGGIVNFLPFCNLPALQSTLSKLSRGITMMRRSAFCLAMLVGISVSSGAAAPAESDPHQMSAHDLNQQVTNPVGTIWCLQSQINNYQLDNGQWNNNWNFQPSLPVSLTNDWNLITRPVIPLYNTVPHRNASDQFVDTTGLGDTILLTQLSPAHSGNWLLGLGPTFILPTATSQFTGQGQWQVGPGGVLGYLTKDFILGVFPQQWWSVAGRAGRRETNQLNVQPFGSIFFGDGWDIGYSGNILADWTAPRGQIWTVPLGINVGKVIKFGRIPVKIQVALQYMVIHPEDSGQKWNIQVQFTPIIPKLITGTLIN